jgi:DNA-binding winged helix-turn-helix (wHTH) protein
MKSNELAATEVRDRGFVFGPFRLEPDGTLLRGDVVVHLPPKELTALRLLVTHAGQIVTPAQLRQALWGEVHVTADSVPRCLSSLRSRLEPEEYIQTIYKRGYRFSAMVRRGDEPSHPAHLRLAVLPFVPGHTVPEHLGPAVAEETITRLIGAQPAIVSVLARDSVFTLAGRGLTAHQIGQVLNADLVLTGTLRALPSQFRLRAEMIRVDDGSQIWVEDLLVPRTRSGGVESELAERLFFRLSTDVPGAFLRARSSPPGWKSGSVAISAGAATERVGESEHREAYELFQFAHHEWQTMQRHHMQDAMQRLLRATELDPTLIAAKVDLIRLCVSQASYGYLSPAAASHCVRRTAESISDVVDQAEAVLPWLGSAMFHFDHDLRAALSAFSLSAHLGHDPWITRARVMFALSRHRFDEAIAVLEGALHEDPYSPRLHACLAWAHHLAGRPGESMKQIRYTLNLFPDHEGAALFGAIILPFNGDAEGGVKLAESLSARQPTSDLVVALHAYALACANRKDEARALLERLQWLSRERFVSTSFNPAAYVALGDHEAALADLRTSEQSRCPWFFQMLADPRLEPLHDHPEFKQMRMILTRMEASASN